MIKAIFFDVDGTLVSFKTHRVPDEVVQAIEHVRRNGVKVFVNTGRMYSLLNNVTHIEFDGFVCNNGACLLDGSGRMLYSDPMPISMLENLRRYLEVNPFPVAFLQLEEMTANMEHPDIQWLSDHINVDMPRVDTLDNIFKSPVYQLCAFASDETMQHLIATDMPGCVATQWTPQFFDVNMDHISKATGLEHMLNLFGIKVSESMAFGDGGNDISMIKHAAIGVAMGNSNVETKAAADYITSSVDNDGVVEALNHFGLL